MTYRKSILCLALLFTGLSTGCHSVTYVQGTVPQSPSVVEDNRGSTFFGFGPNLYMNLYAHQLCPGEVASITTEVSPKDLLWGFLTVGIYTPRTVSVTCSSGTVHQFQLDEQRTVVSK